ncbi:MAG: sterol desaturase family protein, partial [Acidobacteria bacterium]|nr:sterol desaturase family protein [Acidobacteriota bacterium]
FCVGILWGNAFEYGYHRWLLHRPRSSLGKGHLEHHAKVGSPEEPEHVALGKSPLRVAILFTVNGLVLLPLARLFHLSISAGVFLGWAFYLIVTEEIHWRVHLNGWLPPGLRGARMYHMRHHAIPNSRYNVFFPLFDWLFRTNASPQAARG